MTAIIINWSYELEDNNGFLLQKSTDDGDSWVDLPTTGLQYTYTDEDVEIENTYWYRVAATNEYGTGSFSAKYSVYLSSPSIVTVYLTVDAKPDIKPFDGTTISTQTPKHHPDPEYYGDEASFEQFFDSSLVGDDHDIYPEGEVTSNTGIVYDITFNESSGSITGPSTESIDTENYILIPPNTDLPYNEDWYIDVQSISSGSNGFITIDMLPEEEKYMVMKSMNGTNWENIGTALYLPLTMVYGNGVYVGFNAPDNETNAQWSNDGGETWNLITIPTDEFIWDAIYDGSRFIACGNNGTIITSSNGIEWGLESTGVSDCAFRIAFNGSRYVIVGPSIYGSPGGTGLILTSTDLKTWQSVYPFPEPTTNAYLGVAYSPSLNMFLAVGEMGMMASSGDGIDWTDLNQLPPIYDNDITGVTWNSAKGHFAVSNRTGYIFTSPDRLVWTLDTINPHIEYNGLYYNYIKRLIYDASLNKIFVLGSIPVT
jgi:hypothetical protein